MSIKDDYLDAVALMQARVDQDDAATEAIVHHTDPAGLVNALVDMCINAGSTATDTPGDPSLFIAEMRRQINEHQEPTSD